MAGLVRVFEEDGTYSVLASGQRLRSSLSAEDADEVMARLASMEPDEE